MAFAIFIVIANLLINAITDAFLGTTPSEGEAWAWVIIHLVVVVVLGFFAIRFGAVALRETAGGRMRGRGLAITGIVLGSVLVLFTLVATLVQVIAAYMF